MTLQLFLTGKEIEMIKWVERHLYSAEHFSLETISASKATESEKMFAEPYNPLALSDRYGNGNG